MLQHLTEEARELLEAITAYRDDLDDDTTSESGWPALD